MRRLALEMNKQALIYEARKLGTRLPNLADPSINRLSEIKIPVLIIVGVAMDTVQQVESQLIMRHYDSFMKKTRIRGRRG